jgi:hypothetical protein
MMRQALEALIAREACAEILALLEPEELVVAGLRLRGLDDTQIGELLGLDRSAVSQRMIRAQERIVEQRPDLAGLLAGRRMRHRLRQPAATPGESGSNPSIPGGEHVEMETDSGHRRETGRP